MQRAAAKVSFMRPGKFVLLALVIGGVVASARAQLVHLTFSDLNKPFIWQADSNSVPWNMTTGKLRYFEIYYDVATATVTQAPPGRPEPDPDYFYTFSDPTRNFWRFQVTGPEEGTSFTVTHPLGTLYHQITFDGPSQGYQQLGLSFESESGALDLRLNFQGPFTNVGVPVPPFDFDGIVLNHLGGGSNWFNLPHMGTGSVSEGVFASVQASVVPDVGFTPVPEASTYAIGGVAALALGILSRRVRQNRSAPKLSE